MRLALPILLAGLSWGMVPTSAADLYNRDNWSAMTADRSAHNVGDIVTILVYESAQASDTADSGSQRGSSLAGQVSAGTGFNQGASLSLSGQSENSSSTGRTGQMVAQISAVVDEVLPNGDLRISGAQTMDINGERTNIRVKGKVRSADISAQNAVLSTRLADAAIDYDGSGFVSRSAQPGLVTRLFSWLGLP